MGPPRRPSDALAMVAGALHAAERRASDNLDLHEWLNRYDAAILLVSEDEEEWVAEWTISADTIRHSRAVSAIRHWPPVAPETFEEFSVLVDALQALDRWHRPLGHPMGSGVTRLEDHDLVQAHFDIEHSYGADQHGSIIPIQPDFVGGRAQRMAYDAVYNDHHSGVARGTGDARPQALVLAALLTETAYLPNQIWAEGLTSGADLREVRLIYKRPLVPDVDALGRERLDAIAIAPLLESAEDIEISPRGAGYGVRPLYDPDRLREVIRRAVNTEVEVLFLPECSVAEANLQILVEALRTEGELFARKHDDPAPLRYVFVGFSGASAAGTFDSNYVILFDSLGRELMRQHKLFGWDLSEPQVERLGLKEALAAVERSDAGLVRENIEPATEMTILDLDGLGRLIALICADMSFNLPGDWLMQHFRIDFLHAPIMDQTVLDMAFDLGGRLIGSWIGDRAHRAACVGASRIAVSNSMSLTQRLNEFNASSSAKRKAIKECGIGLLIDGLEGRLRYRRMTSALGSRSPVIVSEQWGEDWDDVDYSPRE